MFYGKLYPFCGVIWCTCLLTERKIKRSMIIIVVLVWLHWIVHGLAWSSLTAISHNLWQWVMSNLVLVLNWVYGTLQYSHRLFSAFWIWQRKRSCIAVAYCRLHILLATKMECRVWNIRKHSKYNILGDSSQVTLLTVSPSFSDRVL